MLIVRSLDDLENNGKPPASAVAIGMFDGVHLGHRMVLESAIRQARVLGVPAAVFSFANHPQTLLSNFTPQLLSTFEERMAAFEAMGFDTAVMPDFTPAMRDLSPEAFVKEVLIGKLGVQSVSVGYDHRFGKNRAGNGDVLQACGDRLGFDVQVIAPVRVAEAEHHEIVSSTLIRKLLSYGDVGEAAVLLGRPYALSGNVIEGFARGRTLGFPTANLDIPKERLMPATGVYAGWASREGETYPAVCNIGFSPTFDADGVPGKRMEVFLMDYTGVDFYGCPLTFTFVQKVRNEEKFASKDALVAQIRRDCEEARGLLSLNASAFPNPIESDVSIHEPFPPQAQGKPTAAP